MTPDDDLESKIILLFDGRLPETELRVLEDRFRTDSQARSLYRRYAKLHSALQMQFYSKGVNDGEGVVPVDRIVDMQRKKVIRGSLLSAAAILVLSALVLWWVMVPDPLPSLVTLEASPDSSFTITHQGDTGELSPNDLAEGSQLDLSEGAIECQLKSGVRAILRAPSRLTVLDRNRLLLNHGIAWFEVPEEAKGFTVETDELVVVDLGTEFGVITTGDIPGEVHVFKGSVEATLRNGDQSAEQLQAPQARWLTPQQTLAKRNPDLSQFRTELRTSRNIAIVNHSFEADVLRRDGKTSTFDERGAEDHDPNLIPSGWSGFDDGRGGTEGNRGLVSTASDSFFSQTLNPTPDADANDQCFFSAARDIYQVLKEPLRPNTIYTLTVDVGDRAGRGGGGNPGTPVVHLGSGSRPGRNILSPATETTPKQKDGDWVTWTWTFRTGENPPGAGNPLRIELTSGSKVSWFDNVRLTASR